jgi:branched-chain amino acid transport system substrate-binding protein
MWRVSGALTLVVALTACGAKPVIGVLLPTTGSAAPYGEAMRKAIELGIDDARAAGEFQDIQVVWADSKTDPAVAASEFKRLATEGGAALVIAGVTSGEARELLPVMERTNTLALSPSASAPFLTEESKLFYRLFASDELEGNVAGRFLTEDQGKTSTLIYAGDTEHARGIEPPFRHMFEVSLQGKVVGKVLLGNPNWEEESADLLAAHAPESVYVIAYAENTLKVLRHLRQRDYKGTICLTSAFYSGELIEREPELVEGVFFPQPAFDTQDERAVVQDFVIAFRERFAMDPDIFAAHAYDAIRVSVVVLNETDILQTDELKKTLAFGLEEFPGVTGIIQFDERGDVRHNPIMFIIRDGKVLNYERWLKEEKKRIRDEIRKLLSKP